MKLPKLLLTGLLVLIASVASARAAGTLTPTGAAHTPIQIRAHQVNVTLASAPHASRYGDGGSGSGSGDVALLAFMGVILVLGVWFGRCRKSPEERRDVK